MIPKANGFKTVSVIGLGYIGLPTAAALAARRIQVIGVDVNKEIVSTINKGQIHIIEPELDIVVHSAVTGGSLRATLTPEPADAFLIAVPTPVRSGHQPDLSYIEAAARSIAPVLKKGDLVILESTSPVGATEEMAQWLAEERPDLTFPQQTGEDSDIRVAHCPERVLPGHVMRELIQNDRVIGGMTPKCGATAADLYRVFVDGECILTDVRTAEMCKLTENAFRDVNLAFANELSVICDGFGVNVWELIRLANHHPRVNVLKPGSGVGGHCIAVDPWFIVCGAPEEARLIRTAREVNNGKPHWVVERIQEAIAETCVGRETEEDKVAVALLGLSFKANIDDLRESPAVIIARELAASSRVRLILVEPHITSLPAQLEDYTLSPLETAVEQADIIAILVAHDVFKSVEWSQLTGKRLLDPAGLLH